MKKIDNGYVLQSRNIFDHEIFNDRDLFRFFSLLIGKASHSGYRIANKNIQRGQWLRSYRKLSEDLRYVESNTVKEYPLSRIKRMIDKLKTDGMIATYETDLGTMFKIINYEVYQNPESYQLKSNGVAGHLKHGATEHPKDEKQIANIEGNEDEHEATEHLNTGVAEQQRNNINKDKNVLLCSKLSAYLKENNIEVSEKILNGRLQRLQIDYETDVLEAGINEAVDNWIKGNKEGNFIKYFVTILNNNYAIKNT